MGKLNCLLFSIGINILAHLTDAKLKSLKKNNPGRHADGGGLYFVVPTTTSGEPGEPYWMLRFTHSKKRREM
ncbi:MAG TPA: Arm DNA-binding domain-containing protein, partial [Aliidiomarina sp.]|nr:Arm DNA-binding domain-containing protein [Aliidiomarina sp.]